MKNKWLIGIATGLMAAALCVGFVGCGPTDDAGSTMTDAEKVADALSTLKVMYDKTSGSSTPEDYTVLGQTRVGEELFAVTWTAAAVTEGVTIGDYVSIGKMDESTKEITIGITRGEIDVEYKLTATVTIGEASDSASFGHTIPKNIVVKEGMVGFDFQDVELGGQLNAGSALALLNGAASEQAPLESVEVDAVYQGNGSGGKEYENKGGLVKMGTGSKNGVLTLNFAYPVTKIEIEAQGWTTATETTKLSVNGTEDDAQTLAYDAKAVYTFEFEATAKVTITTYKRAFIFRITATYEEGVHHHVWKYEQADGFKHTRTCTASGCDLTAPETVDCTPVDNVCELCGRTYTAEEIVNALYQLESGESLPGTYKLEGRVTAVEEIDTETFHNATFTIMVANKEILVYRASGTDYEKIKIGDTVTVRGGLTNYGDKYEFSGGIVLSVVDGSAGMNDQEKVDAEKAVLTIDSSALKAVGNTVDLPATGTYGTTITWEVETNDYLEISGGKLTVKQLPASGSAEVKVTATITSGSVTDTKEITVTVSAAAVVENDGTAAHPYKPSEAKAVAEGYPANGYSETSVYVKGYVINAGNFDATYGNWNKVYIADTPDASQSDALYVFRIVPDSTYLKADGDLQRGDLVTFTGYLQNYMGNTPELTYKDTESVVCVGLVRGGEQPEPPAETEFTPITEPAAGEDYYMSMKIADGKEHYITGSLSGYYLATTQDISGAAKVTLRADGNGWLIIVGGKYLELVESGTFRNPAFQTAQTAGKNWEWDSTYNIFTWTDSAGAKWFLGTRNDRTYDTIGGCDYTKYVAQNYLAFIGTLKEPAEKTDQDRVDEVLASLTLSATSFNAVGDAALPIENSYGAQVVWTATDHPELVTVEGSTLKVTALPSKATTVTLHVVVILNGATAQKDVEITVKPETTEPEPEVPGTEERPFTVAEAIAAVSSGYSNGDYYKPDGSTIERVYIAGYVTNAGSLNEYSGAVRGLQNVYIADTEGGSTTLKVNFIYWNDVMTNPNDGTNPLRVGDQVVVYGFLEYYNGASVYYYNGVYPELSKWTPKPITTDNEKVQTVLNDLVLGKTTFTAVEEEIELPTENDYEATVTWTIKDGTSEYVKIEANKLTVIKLPAETTTIELHVVVELGSATAEKDISIVVIAAPVEQEGELLLTPETLFPGLSGTDYSVYNGTHEVGDYTVTTSNILTNTQDGYTVNQLQFKASVGKLTVEGDFTKITIVFVSTYDSSNNGNKLTVTAGSAALSSKVESSVATGIKNSKGFEYSLHTVVFTVTTTGTQTITIEKTTSFAAYVASITFTENDGSGENVVQSIAVYDPAGNDFAGQTIELPKKVTGKNFHGLMLYPTILPLTAPQDYTYEVANNPTYALKFRVLESGKSLDVSSNPNNASLEVGDEATITITATGTEISTTVTLKIVDDADIEYASKFHGYSIEDPFTTDELIDLLDKIGAGRTLKLDVNCGIFLKGKVIRIDDPVGERKYTTKVYLENSKGKEVIFKLGSVSEAANKYSGFTRDTISVGDTLIVNTQWWIDGNGAYADAITSGMVWDYEPAGGVTPGTTYEVTAAYDPTVRGYEQGKEMDGVTDKVKDVSVIYAQSGSTTMPKFYTTEVRIYYGSTFTVSVPEGYKITAITLTYTQTNTVTANVGTLSGKAWTGSETSVVFTVGTNSNGETKGHIRLTKIEITYTSPVEECTHTSLTKVPGTPAECEKDGIADYWTCDECHRWFTKDSAPTDEDEIFTPVVLGAIGHSYTQWNDNEDGASHTATCDNCHTEQSTEAHDRLGEGGKCSKCGGELTAQMKDVDIELTVDALGLTTASYADNNKDHTVGDFEFTTNQAMSNKGVIQLQKGNGTGAISNKTAFPGRIKSIVIVFDATQASAGTIELQLGTTADYGTTKTLDMSAGGNTQTFTADDGTDFRFFKICDPSVTCSIESITITYETLDTAEAAVSLPEAILPGKQY